MAGKKLEVPQRDNFRVIGKSLTPQPSLPTSPDSDRRSLVSSCSSDDSVSSEQFTAQDRLREITKMLQKQLDGLREIIKMNQIKFEEEKAKIEELESLETQKRDQQIEELNQSKSLNDEAIEKMTRVAVEKETVIEEKCLEIEFLVKSIYRIREKAQKIKAQLKRSQIQSIRRQQEEESQNTQKNEEIRLLTEEMESLKSKLAVLEEYLAEAIMVIKEQQEKIKKLSVHKESSYAKFKEELGKLFNSFRNEIVKLNQVIVQNNEQIQLYQQENKEILKGIHCVRDELKEMKIIGKINNQNQNHKTYTETNHTDQINLDVSPRRDNEQRSTENRKVRLTSSTETKLPLIKSTSNPVRESSQFFTKRKGTVNPQLHSMSTPSLNNNAVTNITNSLPGNSSLFVAKSILNGTMQKPNNIHLSTQIISTPHVQIKKRTNLSLDGGISSLMKQTPGREGKSSDKKGTVFMK